MEFIELSEKDKQAYNDFVAASESGSFLQSWEWGEWQKNLGREAYRFFLTNNHDKSSNIVASLQLIKISLPFRKHYLYCPYGPVTLTLNPSPIGRGEGERVNFQSIINELIFKFPDCIFIRIEPKSWSMEHGAWSIKKTTNIQPAKTLIINLSKTEEQLLGEMHPKTRYNIKLAQKHGVEIKDEFDISIGHGLYAKEAVELIVQTSKRHRIKGYPAEYYYKIIDCLALRNRSDLKLHIYKAVYNNKLLASAIIMDFGKVRTFLFGGSSQQDKNVMAPYLLHWQAMLDAKAAGLSQYDFWGVETSSGEMPGFVRFKLSFGGEMRQYPGAYDLIFRKFEYNVYNILRKIKRIF